MAIKVAEPLEKQGFSSNSSLDKENYRSLKTFLGREPNSVELAMIDALWSEHCSYKSSKRYLNRLPSDAPWVICGPGENAGVIDIGDNLACVLKMESHNHPSSINPHHGAATGVGGILRDIFAMGAHPIAVLDALFLGDPTHPKTSIFLKGIVSGVSSYGNCFGAPTVSGSIYFHAAYNANPLVNVMAIGLVRKDHLLTACASGVGNSIFYIGAKTGHDGIHGATQSSRIFANEQEPAHYNKDTHIPDPLTGYCVLQALHALREAGIVIAAQDMGAAGLTCASIEMATRGNMGFVMHLDSVPQSTPPMDAESLLLSETQERMLLIVKSGTEKEAEDILRHWEISYACIGHLTNTGKAIIYHRGSMVAHIPLHALHEATPFYDRPYQLPTPHLITPSETTAAQYSNREALKILMSTPNGGSKRWIYEQYDRTIQGNSVETCPGNAAIIRIPNSLKGLALTTDVTPRYCAADPFEGAKQAVAEACRNITAVGAIPKAITDCLNFGSPDNESVMGQLITSIEGLREACLALALPIISGNVSLYNETAHHPILPTPTVGCVGLLEDVTKRATLSFKNPGEVVFLLGHTKGWLHQSIYARDILGREDGSPPPVDLAREKQFAQFVHTLIAQGYVTAVHDCSDGGFLVALGKMALASFERKKPCGVTLQPEFWTEDMLSLPRHAFFFGEDQGRYVLTADPSNAHELMSEAHRLGIPCMRIGLTGGSHIMMPEEAALPLKELRDAHEQPLVNRLSTGL